MPTPDLSHLIPSATAPVIVISACGLLCLAYNNRLAAVVMRLRAFDRERLAEQDSLRNLRRANSSDESALVGHQELLGALEVQTRHVLHRARLIRRTLICFLLTIGLLSLCSLAVGLGAFWTPFGYVAVSLFVTGMLLLVLGVIFALIEMKHALDPIELEGRFVTEMLDRMNDAPRSSAPNE